MTLFRLALIAMLLAAAPNLHAEEKKAEQTAEQKAAEQKKKEQLEKISKIKREDLFKKQKGDLVMGREDAPVTIVEYASLSCSHCATFHKEVYGKLKDKYVDSGKLKVYFRHFPLNDPALRGAMLVQCTPEAKREAFLTTLFNTQEKWAFEKDYKEKLANIARIGGMKKEDFDACMANEKLADEVMMTMFTASKVLEIKATPSVFVNGQLAEDRTLEQLDRQVGELAERHAKKGKKD